jgi:hypothetical protein
MIHRKCGLENPNAPCMRNGKCRGGFPKNFCDETTVAEKGYTMYRRRDDGRKIVIDGVEFDNRDVVPYSAYLLKKYGCHINCEIVASSKSLKYLHKYMTKATLNYRLKERLNMMKSKNMLKEDIWLHLKLLPVYWE